MIFFSSWPGLSFCVTRKIIVTQNSFKKKPTMIFFVMKKMILYVFLSWKSYFTHQKSQPRFFVFPKSQPWIFRVLLASNRQMREEATTAISTIIIVKINQLVLFTIRANGNINSSNSNNVCKKRAPFDKLVYCNLSIHQQWKGLLREWFWVLSQPCLIQRFWRFDSHFGIFSG